MTRPHFVRLPCALRRALIAVSLALISGSNALVFAQTPGSTRRLDFDDVTTVVGPGNQDVTGLEIGDWFVASLGFHTVSDWDAGLLTLPDNGTPYIASDGGGDDFPIFIERNDGSPFSLVGFDAAEGFLDDLLAEQRGYTSATKIEIEAALSNGLTVTLEYDLDGFRDGPDGGADFESFTMPADLQSVTSVTFTGLSGLRRDAGFALDNIVVGIAIPEPASMALVAAGSVMFAIRLTSFRRRKRGHRTVNDMF
jgi:hypothetical protein